MVNILPQRLANLLPLEPPLRAKLVWLAKHSRIPRDAPMIPDDRRAPGNEVPAVRDIIRRGMGEAT